MTRRPLAAYQHRIRHHDLQADPAQEKALAALERLYDQLAASQGSRASLLGSLLSWSAPPPQPVRGVYLWGGVGRGKSLLMDLFAASLPRAIRHRRVHFHAFMIGVHDWLHRHRGDRVDTLLPDLAAETAAHCRVICFDEFHVHDVADAMILKRLFTALLDHGVVVVATSNYHPDELYKRGLQRHLFVPFIALLKERLEVLHLDGAEDYRARCLRAEGTYFCPLGSTARAKADQVFAHLTDDAPACEETLEVKGRKIPVTVVAKGAARFTFAELCEGAHGAEDYLTIAATYHTVFLDGVPILDDHHGNEAKRLMTLIDALYDTRTKLVITAAGQPEQLYRGQDLAFDFRRTASRLREMQSEAYLAS
jgi:cell division protein ZapE